MNMHIDLLIECVRKHVFLYDINHMDYKNVNLKNAAWEAIGQELQQSGDAVRTKWKTLRDGYTKYKKLSKNSSGTNKRLSQYLWSSQLSFLDDYNVPRHRSATESPPSNQMSMDSEKSQEFCVPETNTKRTQGNKVDKERLSRSTKRSNSGNVDELFNIIEKKKKNEYDGIDHLFLSYAETFKRFPLREQVILKLELAKLFSSTELRLLQNNDLQYSTSSAYSSDWMDNAYEGFKSDTYVDIKPEPSDPSQDS